MSHTIRMITLTNDYKIWTRTSQKGNLPLLLLHGGPGSSHECFENFESLLAPHGYQVIVYDQLGSHNSDKPTDQSLWTIERFTEEVEEVRQGLGLETFFLLGHSWGGMLAIEYALKYQQHLRGLIISNMTAGVADYENRMANLRYNMPQEVQDQLTSFEQNNDLQNPAYQELLREWLFKKHFCRISPLPEDLRQAFGKTNRDIYNFMWGKNEFIVEGTLKTWNRWDELDQIKVPTLLMGGQHDIIDPLDLECMAREIRGARSVIFKKSSHVPFYEEQDAYFKTLVGFMNSTEQDGIK